jgi:hypothetical protein
VQKHKSGKALYHLQGLQPAKTGKKAKNKAGKHTIGNTEKR